MSKNIMAAPGHADHASMGSLVQQTGKRACTWSIELDFSTCVT